VKTIVALAATLMLIAGCGGVDQEAQLEETTLQGVADLENTTCPVMGDEVMEGQYVDWQGYRVHFCCAGCDRTFLEDPEYYMGILAEDPSVSVDLSSYSVTEDHSSQENSMSDQCSMTDGECIDCTAGEDGICETCSDAEEDCLDCMASENGICETCRDNEETSCRSREDCCTMVEPAACHAG